MLEVAALALRIALYCFELGMGTCSYLVSLGIVVGEFGEGVVNRSSVFHEGLNTHLLSIIV